MSQFMLSAIVAMSSNRVIGYHNQLPWHLPADLQRFKALTVTHTVIMGRKTFVSIGKSLPNRVNIVLSQDTTLKIPGAVVFSSLKDALSSVNVQKETEVFLIGGAEVFKSYLHLVQKLYLTIIHHAFEGDAFFPILDQNQWRELSREDHAPDEKNKYAYSFVTLARIGATAVLSQCQL